MLTTSNISLQPYHSFASQEQASYFTKITCKEDVVEVVNWTKENKLPFLVIGSGTNLLFTKNFHGLVAKMELTGVKKLEETGSEVILEVGAGENWHHFVSYCVQKGWGGIENLSLIPGTVGASPIQNIGAYGVEVQECIKSINAFDTHSQNWVELKNNECAFGYRTSIFSIYPNRYIITSVKFVLNKQPQLKTDYGVIREVLHDKNIKNPSLENVSNAIIQIRSQKLPDPKVLGNAGSFFKNPIITSNKYEFLKDKFSGLIAYPISDDAYKVAAGWLIEACKWNGLRKGNVGCYEKQALVIVSYGITSGMEVFDFSEEIIQSIKDKFDILLEREVTIIS
jgi:UDP-N-acetylmuramate dehydrogenase